MNFQQLPPTGQEMRCQNIINMFQIPLIFQVNKLEHFQEPVPMSAGLVIEPVCKGLPGLLTKAKLIDHAKK